MAISDEELFKTATTYRIHQDTLRWTLLAGYAAFLVGILSIDVSKFSNLIKILLVAIGICYMFILAVENFFYNLFSEYVKDCELRLSTKESLRTLKEFSENKANMISPFHHSYFFAMLVVLLGNFTISSTIGNSKIELIVNGLNTFAFILIFFMWRRFVYPYIVIPIQKIFEVRDEDKNCLWKLKNKFRRM